ncbi:unnamed protein product [Arctogadus glacialis]
MRRRPLDEGWMKAMRRTGRDRAGVASKTARRRVSVEEKTRRTPTENVRPRDRREVRETRLLREDARAREETTEDNMRVRGGMEEVREEEGEEYKE